MKIYGYIYMVRNRANGKVYVGLTTGTIRRRWIDHKASAKCGRGRYFAAAIRKYGPDNFTIVELGRAFSNDELDDMEKRSIWAHESTDPEYGYNLLPGGGSAGLSSDETKAKQAAASKNRSKELRAKVSATLTGQKRTPETRAKMSAAHKGRKKTPEHIAKLTRLGSKHSEETKAKISASGKQQWERRREGLALAAAPTLS
jgi:group I intron endonuclease